MTRSRPVVVALLSLVGACMDLTDASPRGALAGSLVIVSAAATTQLPPGPFVSVLDSLDVRATVNGKTVQRGKRLQRYDTSAVIPIELDAGSASVAIAILSNNGTTVFSGSGTGVVTTDGFQIPVRLSATQPIMVGLPDTLRTSGPSAGQFTVWNSGPSGLTWSVLTVDTAITRCNVACTMTPYPAVTSGSTFSVQLPPSFPSRTFNFVLRSNQGTIRLVWQYTAPVVTSVTTSPANMLLSVGTQLQASASVVSTGSTAVGWLSVNPAIASVSTTGLVTGVSPGTTIVRATSIVDGTKSGATNVQVIGGPAANWAVTAPAAFDTLTRDGVGKVSATLTARATGPTATFQNPYTTVQFWVRSITPSSGPPTWRFVGVAGAPTLVDNGINRFYSYSMVWNPDATSAPFPNPSLTRLEVIAIGITSSGTLAPAPTNNLLWVRVP